MSNYPAVANTQAWESLPPLFWTLLGGAEAVLGIAIIVASIMKKQKIVAYSAAAQAVICLSGLALFSSFAGFPGMLWGIIPAALYGFVAYKRFQSAK